MRYFIGYLIQGEAGEWHRACAKDISEKFNTEKIGERIPPHITFVPPFDAEDISLIKDMLHEWIANRPVYGEFTLSGFGWFDDRTVFAAIEADKLVTDAVYELQTILRALPGMSAENQYPWRPHATLANHVRPSDTSAVREYVRALPAPHFVLLFDNATLFRRDEGGVWRVDEIFYFKNTNTKPILYILCGLPYSGKTTLARELSRRSGFEIVSMDNVMDEEGLDPITMTQTDWDRIYFRGYKTLERLLSEGKSVVLDASNLKRGERDTARGIAERVNAEHMLIYLDVPFEESVARHLKNQKINGRAQLADVTMQRAASMFEAPTPDENPVVYKQEIDVEDWIRKNITR